MRAVSPFRCIAWFLWAFCALSANGQIVSDEVPKSTTQSSSNNKDGHTFLLLNMGLAAPLGSFGSNSVLDDEAGYAISGLNIHANFGRTFNRFVGITGTGGFIVQNTRLAEIVDNFNRYNTINEQILDFEYPGMRFLYAAGGLLVTLPATSKFSIDLKVQGGFALGIDRELTLKKQDIAGIYIEKYGKASDFAFLPDIGLNFRLLVTKNFTMNFFTDFVSANFNFKNVTYYKNGVPVGTYDYELKMRNLNVGIGAGWTF